MSAPAGVRVLLLGATGFIGQRLLEALLAGGYDVTCGVREPEKFSRCRAIPVDFTRDHSESEWLAWVAAIDVVINAVGILRETGRTTFEALHVAAPVALFRASARAGVKKIVQISALGADENAASGYHRSKKRADDALAALDVPWVIVQPSLVFGEGGQSASLFTRLAALPVIPVPGAGDQRIQPVHVADLVAAVVRLLETKEHDRQRLAAVGPHAMTLRDFLAALRASMRLGEARFMRVPMFVVGTAAAAGDHLSGVLLDRESLGMLVRGNVAPVAPFAAVLGRSPRAVEAFIEPRSARAVASEARIGWLLPLLRVAVALVWMVTGIVSLGVYPLDESYALLARVRLTGVAASIALYGAALLDLALGVGTLVMRRAPWLWRAQMMLIVGYTATITFYLPEFWIHPYGPLTKNLPMLAAILVLHEFDKQ